MKKITRRFSVWILGAVVLSGLNTAQADWFTHRWEDQHQQHEDFLLAPQLRYYNTKKNYDSGSVSNPINNGASYSVLGLDLPAALGVSDVFTAYARISWVRAQTKTNAREASSFGFADQTLGLNYRAVQWTGGAALDFQLQADLPAYDNTRSQSQGLPFVGESTMDTTLGGFLVIPLRQTEDNRIRMRVGLGYTWRSDDYSAGMPWSLDIDSAPRDKGLYLGIAAFGFRSSKEYVIAQTSTAASVVGSAGSFFIGQRSPSVAQFGVKVGYQMNDVSRLIVDFQNTFWGKLAPGGYQVALAFQYRWNRSPNSDVPFTRGKTGTTPNKDSFTTYTGEARVESVNDRLNLVKVGKGSNDGFRPGQTYDIFSTNSDGTVNEVIARAQVTNVKENEAILKIKEFFKEVWVEEGFIVKRPLH